MKFKKELDSTYRRLNKFIDTLDIKVDNAVKNVKEIPSEERLKILSSLSENVVKNSAIDV